MPKKKLEFGDNVVGRSKRYRNRQGSIIDINVGPKRNLIRVRWLDGSTADVTTYAIGLEPALQAMTATVDQEQEQDNQSAQVVSTIDSEDDDLSSSNDSSSVIILNRSID